MEAMIKRTRTMFRWEKRDKEKYQESLERCTVCNCITDVPVNTPITERKTYLPTGGQLCSECCWKLYHTHDLRTIPELYHEFVED